MVNVGTEQIGLHDPTSRVVEKLAHCVDPQSNIQPYKWSIMMQTEKGTLEAVTYAMLLMRKQDLRIRMFQSSGKRRWQVWKVCVRFASSR